LSFGAQLALMCSERAVDNLGYMLLTKQTVTVIKYVSNYGRRIIFAASIVIRADNIGNVLIKRQRLVKCYAKQLHGLGEMY